MSSIEQGNMLLQAVSDANDNIRAENLKNFQDYQNKLKTDKQISEGEEWYHGVTDVVGTHGALKAFYDNSKRLKDLKMSYVESAGQDVKNVGSTILNAGKSVGSQIREGVSGVKGALFSKVEKQPEPSVSDPAPEEIGSSTTSIPEETAGIEGATAEEGSLSEKVLSKLTGSEVGSVASKGLGKALGNIGGGIDIVKDFENVAQGKDFLGGTGETTGDKVSNALAVGGTVLDVASLALPFLAPIAATVQVAGAIDGTYQSVKDNEKQKAVDKSNYQKQNKSLDVPPSLSGTGFLASAGTDSHKLIGGTSAF
jgi:hypothetical protein